MIDVAYPEQKFNTKVEDGKDYIFDSLRKKWLLLTPEEWVRQNFLQYLIQVKSYASSLIAVEKMITVGEMKKRFDILVYDREHNPWLMVECKAPSVALIDDVLHQVLRYNISVPVQFLVITNGSVTLGWEKKEGVLIPLKELPTL